VTGGDAEEDRPVCQHRSVLIISYSVLQICYCVSCPFDKKSPAVNRERVLVLGSCQLDSVSPIVKDTTNNNDRLTAFDPGQPG